MGEVANVPLSKYREALAKIDALQAYVSRLPLRSEVDKLEAEVLRLNSLVSSLNEALDSKRRREAALQNEVEVLAKRLEEKPPDSERNLSAFFASQRVAEVLDKYEEEIKRNFVAAKAWEQKAARLEASAKELEALLNEKNVLLNSTKSELDCALSSIEEHKKLEADVLQRSACLHRRFRAYVDDTKEVLAALSEALDRRELEPVLLLGAMLGQVRSVPKSSSQAVTQDFKSYGKFVRLAADEMVDLRDELHVLVEKLVDACAKYIAKSTASNTCALQ